MRKTRDAYRFHDTAFDLGNHFNGLDDLLL